MAKVAFFFGIIISCIQCDPHSLKYQGQSVHQDQIYVDVNQDNQDEIMAMNQPLFVRVLNNLNSVLGVWNNLKDQVQSQQDTLNNMRQQNKQNLIEINSLTKQIDATSDWQKKYEDLSGKYTDVKAQLDGVMHKKEINLFSQQNDLDNKSKNDQTPNQRFTVIGVFMMCILSIVGTFFGICANKPLKTKIGQIMMSVIPESCKNKDKAVNIISIPDPLSSVIQFNDTPNNSNPNSRPATPKDTHFTIPSGATSSQDVIIFDDDDAKMQELPNTIR